MAKQQTLETLSEEIAQLRQELASLKHSMTDSKGRAKLSMRDRNICPVCGERRIAHFATVPDAANNGVIKNRGLASKNRGIWKTDSLEAHLECFACVACGFVESYVSDTTFFAEHRDLYRLIESEQPEGGPFR